MHHADLELIALAATGNRAATARLALRLDPVIRNRVARVLRRLTPTHTADAEDIAQIVWVVLLDADARQLRAYRPERGITLEAYVGMIAEREVRNAIARACAAKRGAERTVTLSTGVGEDAATPSANPEEQLVAADLADRLVGALVLGFPARAQPVLSLCIQQETRADDAARSLGMPPQQVHNWLFRLRKASRAFLEAA